MLKARPDPCAHRRSGEHEPIDFFRDRIAGVTAFVTAELAARWDGVAADLAFTGADAFPRFGLPAQLAG